MNAHFEFNYASEISDTKIVIIALIVSEFSEQRTLWHCDKQAFDFLNHNILENSGFEFSTARSIYLQTQIMKQLWQYNFVCISVCLIFNTGSSMIGVLEEGCSCVAIEEDPILYIQSKLTS